MTFVAIGALRVNRAKSNIKLLNSRASQGLNSLTPGNFIVLFSRLLIFFKINFFEKILSILPSECQTDWIQIRTTLSGDI